MGNLTPPQEPARPAARLIRDGSSRQDLADLLRRCAIRRTDEAFQLSTGAWSRDFVDLRGALSAGAALATAARAFIDTLDEAGASYAAIGGMTMGADPIAHSVAVLSGVSWFSIRKQEKREGSGRLIDGATIRPGLPVVLVDDTVSSGQSVIRAVQVLQDRHADIVAVCALLDRSTHLAPALAERSIRYLPVLTYDDVGIEAVEEGT
jgi:orotate phosphoribosyltransferase